MFSATLPYEGTKSVSPNKKESPAPGSKRGGWAEFLCVELLRTKRSRSLKADYALLMCPETSFVISNIVTCFLPLNTTLRASSALIRVRFFSS